MFSLFIPDSARITVTDSSAGGLSLAWPRCPDCRFGVGIRADSGVGLEARIARMVAAQHAIDSTNSDPNTIVQEFDEIDGPPQQFQTAAGRGYLVDENCGDCVAITVLFGRPGYVAELALGGDAGVPDINRHVCEMTVVAKTLAWRQ
jgi:hypothetical protein